MAKPNKDEFIERRADELWNRTGRDPEQKQDCWDKAVHEYEAGTSEAERGPVKPDPTVGDESSLDK
jgi:hypothetical protein